jgi:release factor glutamine methyltransferase
MEARLLAAHALGTTPAGLLRNRAAPVDPAPLEPLLRRRIAHEPLALIVGHREFWSLDFAVSPATLIPRPESETLIEAALAAFSHRPSPRMILDLGTGTGCLLLAALSEFPAAFGVGIDRSAAAAALAAHNSATLRLADRAAFICGDWAGALAARFDLVLCNPPYIPTSEIPLLMPEVARYEPRAALDGGSDGFAAFRRLIPMLPDLMAPTGIAVLEFGPGQLDTIAGLGRMAGMTVAARHDLAGNPRALVLGLELP